MRRLVPLLLVATLAACPSYDAKPYLSSQDGLMNADTWAKYGPEQAIAVAVGREYGQHDATQAAAYGKQFAQVDSIQVDSLGNRLVVHFKDGWAAQVNPIDDGKSGAETEGLPAAK